MKFIVLLIFMILFFILENRKFVNLKAILDGIFFLLCILCEFFLFVSSIILLMRINNHHNMIWIILLVIFVFWGLIIFTIFLVKNHILGTVRTLNYCIHKESALKNGNVDVRTVVDIKYDAVHKHYLKYYLVVDYKGKKIKSTYFLNNVYNIGQKIDVVTYKKYNFVAIDYNFFN